MHRITGAAIVGALALALTGLAVAAPAAAVEPGDGAVIFNPDGTPIGSETVYPSGDPQYVYTSTTGDDDQWGLLADGNPENGTNWTEGIPLGFTININGLLHSTAIVTSNGAICLIPDGGGIQIVKDSCWTYDNSPATLFSASMNSGQDPGAFAAVLALANDQYPPYAETPVDTGGGPEPDACTFGAFLFFDGVDYYCSAVSWGTTTYEGKAAFAATWYHNPDYDAETDEPTWFSTYQAIIVDDGGGNALIVLNYDEVNQTGEDAEDLNDYGPPYQDACEAQVDGGDTANYLVIGIGSTNADHTSNPFIDLFGPACAGGVFPTADTALQVGGSSDLATHSLNSTVPGRYILGWVNGQPTYFPTLPATGPESPAGTIAVGALALLAGLGLVVSRRARRQA